MLNALIFLFVAGTASAQSYQDPTELQGRADRYARQAEKLREREFQRELAEGERQYQASGGRSAPNQSLLKGLARATGQDVSGAYWQGKKTKGGKFVRSEGMALITNLGFYCFKTRSGFVSGDVSCYYDNGAPYLSFEYMYKDK